MNFGIPLPPNHPYYGVWRHHWGREIEELDGGKFIKVHPALLPHEKIQVFIGYRSLSQEIDADAERNPFHSCSILGNPGIGKSTFLSYKLCLQLAARLPTVYYSPNAHYSSPVYFFTERGVYEVKEQLFVSDQFSGGMALIDAGPGLPAFIGLGVREFYSVLVSSPWKARYHEFQKQLSARRVVAQAPSFDEACSMGITEQGWACRDSQRCVENCLVTVRPIPSTRPKVLRKGPEYLEEHRREILEAVQALSTKQLTKIPHNPESGHAVTHKLVKYYPSPDFRNFLAHRLISLTIFRVLASAYTRRPVHERLEFYAILHDSGTLN
ncbi:hypothetical protein GYMLUDRAFT_258519 [Collybiopsis luxurians FD-317 M1]|nr:hypothetical protein GYMLUDRAFT_258519 [Collybiopsis luxurians FD-317 M1]